MEFEFNLKLILLSDANSIHTLKWVESLNKEGLKILLFTLFKPSKEILDRYKKNNIKLISPQFDKKLSQIKKPVFSKLIYLKSLPLLKKTIRTFQPDLLHSHYASSYGLLGRLSGFEKCIVSAWGSDIYYFPNRNFINKILIKSTLMNAKTVCSTSEAMKKVIEDEFNVKRVKLTPFGVDTSFFVPNEKPKKKFIIGTIKSIEDYNGIDCLIDAANIVINDYKENLDFLIVGSGTKIDEMKRKAKMLNLQKKITFTGFVNHNKVINYYNKISLFVAVSTRESFGVSILEAAACGIPSITSNIGGLKEVNLNNITGKVINPNNPQELAKSIILLYKDNKLRNYFSQNARKRVEKYFNWNNSVKNMLSVYNRTLNNDII